MVIQSVSQSFNQSFDHLVIYSFDKAGLDHNVIYVDGE